MKTCNKCKAEKSLEDFHRDSRRLDGRRDVCKVCTSATRPSRAGSQQSRDYWERFYAERREELLTKMRENPARRAYARARYAEKGVDIRAQQRVYRSTDAAKQLHAAQQRKRTSRIRDATPGWLNEDQRAEIQYLYWHARDATAVTGEPYHVDHIVPLRGRTVCGLHVPWNLRVVPADINLRKHISLEEY